MPTAGYSGTPLPKKLEIKEGTRVATVGAPADFARTLGKLPPGAKLQRGFTAPRDLTIWFITSRKQAVRQDDFAQHVLGHVRLHAGRFLRPRDPETSFPLLRRDAAQIPLELVDRKVCAIDATWSGLLFSWRRP